MKIRALIIAGLLALAPVAGWKAFAATSASSNAPPSQTVKITSSQSYTVPAWATSVSGVLQAAGGGSGGCASGCTFGGGSGGGGAAFYLANLPVTGGSALTITIGAGGTAGTASPTAGGTGGATCISGLSGITTSICANGGGGGSVGGASATGGTGGTVPTGAIGWPGQNGVGNSASLTCPYSGATVANGGFAGASPGACSYLGPGVGGASLPQAGLTYGGGASSPSSNGPGAAGAQGVVILTFNQ